MRCDGCDVTMAGCEEVDYVASVNRVLPRDIRAVAWAPVPVDFDARHVQSVHELLLYHALPGSVHCVAHTSTISCATAWTLRCVACLCWSQLILAENARSGTETGW